MLDDGGQGVCAGKPGSVEAVRSGISVFLISWTRQEQVNLADLNSDEDQASKKIRLCIEEAPLCQTVGQTPDLLQLLWQVQGRNCLTDFHGMTLTRDKICSLIKKQLD